MTVQDHDLARAACLPWLCASFLLAVATACATTPRLAEKREAQAALDPRQGSVPLPCAEGFEAWLLHAGGEGIWTVGVHDVSPAFGGPEIVTLDDAGRCIVLVRNSGKTTPLVALEDGTWLGGLAHGDVDPERAGSELYVGAQRGNLYQVIALPQGGFDVNVIAYFPGAEVHALAVIEEPRAGVGGLYAGLSTGAIYRLLPSVPLAPVPLAPVPLSPVPNGQEAVSGGADARAQRSWTRELVHQDPGRIRQLLPAELDGTPRLFYVSRAGRAVMLSPTPAGWRERLLYEASQGLARLCVGANSQDGAPVIYVAGDTGEVLRLAHRPGESWRATTIHVGPEGARGIVSGPFTLDPEEESLALFGYSGRVDLLVGRPDGGWSARTLFEDLDRGHWLAAGELDLRNSTREIVASGYSGRVVLLARPPGFGLALPQP